jgi:hypothetical protein
MTFNLYDFYLNLRRDGIIFCFSGPVSQSIVEGIGETIKQKMELEDAGVSATQKVFAIFVEQMQNVLNHSSERITDESVKEGELRLGVLVVGQENDRFYVFCGNKIEREKIAFLKENLDMLRGMDKEQLKNLYRERRKAVRGEGSKGAGLGFIEMARKACKPIEYDFSLIDDNHAFFSIKVII